MFERLVTTGGRREQMDEFARFGTEKVLPQLKRLDGFEVSLVLAKRRSGEIAPKPPAGKRPIWRGRRSSLRNRGERILSGGFGCSILYPPKDLEVIGASSETHIQYLA